MLFNVSVLLRSPVGEKRDYDLGGDSPVHHGKAVLTRTPNGVLVGVQAAVVLDECCSRCLVPFGYPVDVAFEEVFVQQVDPVSGRRLSRDDAAGDSFLISLDHLIDITEAVRQYSLMAAAMQPLCRPDCVGLCVQCGKDLNLGSCTCDRAPIDSRWAALAVLKQSSNG
jgi:uncharacterized protein